MKQARSAAQIAQKTAAFFGRGSVTNCFLGMDELERACADGNLYFDEAPGALLLYRRLGGFYRMNFYLREDAPLPQLPEETIVTEIAYRARDAALIAAVERWKTSGMAQILSRHRMKRAAGAPEEVLPPEGVAIETAKEDELDTAMALLTGNFSPVTGCLPTQRELLSDIQSGGVLLARIQGREVGLVRMQTGKMAAEIRQLAVEKAFRGKGAASALVKAALQTPNVRAWRVWVVQGNDSAARVYEKQGFTDDGFTSVVLKKP